MAIAQYDTIRNQNNNAFDNASGGGSTCFGAAGGTGLLALVFRAGDSSAVTSVTDSAGNVWTRIATYDSNSYGIVYIYGFLNFPSSITSVSWTLARGYFHFGMCATYTGVGSFGSAYTANGTSTNPSASITTSSTSSWVFGAFNNLGDGANDHGAMTGGTGTSNSEYDSSRKGMSTRDAGPGVSLSLDATTSFTNNWAFAGIELIIAPPTTIVKSIGTAGGRDYSSVADFIAAVPADLTSAYQIWIGDVYNDSPLETTVSITNTTDVSCYIVLRAASGNKHLGRPSTGAKLKVTSGNTEIIRTSTQRLYIQDLEFEVSGSANNSTGNYGMAVDSTAGDVFISRCIFSSVANAGALISIDHVSGLNPTMAISDCFLFCADTSKPLIYIFDAARRVNIENCTLFRGSQAILIDSHGGSVQDIRIYNTTAVMQTTCLSDPQGFAPLSGSNNICTDLTIPGSTQRSIEGFDFKSITAGAEDPRVLRTFGFSYLLGQGTDRSAARNVIGITNQTDILGEARP